jgi:serine/threonine protein kinase
MAKRRRRTREDARTGSDIPDPDEDGLAVVSEPEAEAREEKPEKEKWAFREGDTIAPGRYVLKRLGGGSAYEAWVGWDDVLHATVVLKVLRPDHAQQKRSLEHLRREIQVLQRLSHPVIVRCFGAVTGGDVPHIVLEHLEGLRLSTLIRRYGQLPIEQLLPLGLQICSALHYVHSQRLVHLDVKPANIVMSADPKLIDFSIARTWKQAAALTGDVGTRRFMAPEQCLPGKRGPVGAPADVWGLGATLYRAASKEYPFEFVSPSSEPDPFKKFPQLTEEAIPLSDEIPVQVREPIMACLNPDPSQRPSAAELFESLQPLVSMLPTARPLGRKRPRLR